MVGAVMIWMLVSYSVFGLRMVTWRLIFLNLQHFMIAVPVLKYIYIYIFGAKLRVLGRWML